MSRFPNQPLSTWEGGSGAIVFFVLSVMFSYNRAITD